ncbi:MAG: hypothetical protein V7752_10035 [Halopseudomonas sp.]
MEHVTDPSRRKLFSALRDKIADPSPVKSFQRVADIGQQTSAVFWAMAAQAADNIFVAGDDGLIFHYDGECWQQQRGCSDLPIHSLCFTQDKADTQSSLIAVGWLGLIAEYRRGEWHHIQGGQRVTSTSDAQMIRQNLPLFDVARASNGDLWAVGDQGRVTRFDGRQWQELDSGSRANLRSVLPLDDGSVLIGGSSGTLLRYREGPDQSAQWQTIVTDSGSTLVSMASADGQTVFCVGFGYNVEAGGFVGHLFEIDGDSGQQISSGTQLPRLRCIAPSGDGFLVTGDDGFAFRVDPNGTKRLATQVRFDLHRALTLDSGEVLICGDGGTLLIEKEQGATALMSAVVERTPPSWAVWDHGLSEKILRGVWVAPDQSVFAVGDQGTVLHFDGCQWALTELPQQTRLHSVWGTSSNNVYACGENATIYRFNGVEWQQAYSGQIDNPLLAITGFGPHDIFVVGDNGMALRYDGLQWRKMNTGTQAELYGLWGLDAEHLLAVGGGGVVMRWNGEQWASFYSGRDNDVFGVWGESLNRIFLVGLPGSIIRFSGSKWEKEFSSVRTDLHAVTGVKGGPVFAVGSLGVVLRNDGSEWQLEPCAAEVTLTAVASTDDYVVAVGHDGTILKRLLTRR